MNKNPMSTKNRVNVNSSCKWRVSSMKRKISQLIKLFTIVSLALLVFPSSGEHVKVRAFSNQIIQQGAVGDDVIELQSRLQYLGFYNGKIDGVFGWGTYWALRNFQYEFGLPIDGLAGAETKAKLAKASKYHKDFVKKQINEGKKFTHYGGTPIENQSKGTNNATNQPKTTTPPKATTPPKNGNTAANKNTQATQQKPTAANVPAGFSQNDIQLMANAVYGESRGEPYTGQVAVAAVILNRVQSASFPNTVSGVIFEPRAFTAVADGQIWLTPNETAKKAVLDAINGWDPTGNALYYFNPDTATSGWIWGRPQIKRIGKHIFCK
jgi:N-acetylmuramoyl-L-alanine amidase